MELPTPLILEDWEDYLKGLHPEPGPALPFRLHLEIESWPHGVAALFERANPPRPYPHETNLNPDEQRRMIWVLNGMRSYLKEKLQALLENYFVATGALPLVGDEFFVRVNDKEWSAAYAIKKRIAEFAPNKSVDVHLVVTELEWVSGETGFSSEDNPTLP